MQGIPQCPEKPLIRTLSRTMLGVGQSEGWLHPISKCCGMRADRRRETPWGGTEIEDWWYCCYCNMQLEEFTSGPDETEAVKIGKFNQHSVRSAISQWTGIPLENLNVKIEFEDDTT